VPPSAGVESVSVTTRRAGDITDVRRGGLMSDTVTDVKAYQWCAGGQWRDVAGGKLFDDFEPYTGNLYARVADCGADEARLAIAAAHGAFNPWADLPPAEKARLFFKAAEVVRRRAPEVAGILARETGSTIPFSTFQQDLVASTLEQAANWVYLPKGEVLASNLADTHSTARTSSLRSPI
jgi:acyl-CoA reductase-like NAD-dependent aldehyde dehydrogenase